ncbi:hypothetical protein [Nocardia sp. alder85J]|uniref:hypothetical protein n=1 Tax=Nocardia sp. alder85J TaxID=2862949 RepID=UPI001CD65411|nr:hypothetical protein [Nocardia sp. alder85J]MCX4099214.1 hypothetical protein [Nocardia sp. alder85J]
MRLLPTKWTPEMWARAAAPALPRVQVTPNRRMVAPGTPHLALYVGDGRWVVSWLPGRQFEAGDTVAALRIALAPDWPDVEQWAAQLGLTAAEARSFVAVP